LVMMVLSVILSTREVSFPAIVKVFALSSTEAIIPLNAVARILGGDASALEAAALSASGEGEPFALASLRAGKQIATTAKNAAIIKEFISFMH